MNRNHLVPRPTAPPTRGEEEKRAACAGNPEPFDVLMDARRNDNVQLALLEAKALCDSCDLKAACWAANADEPWLLALHGTVKPKRKRNAVAPCGTTSGYSRHRRLDEQPCLECKQAKAEESRRNYFARKEAS